MEKLASGQKHSAQIVSTRDVRRRPLRGRAVCEPDGVNASHLNTRLAFTPPASHPARLCRAAGRSGSGTVDRIVGQRENHAFVLQAWRTEIQRQDSAATCGTAIVDQLRRFNPHLAA